MLELQGKYNKDCKIFAEAIEPEAYTLINKILDERASEGVAVRIMPDVHVGKDIVVGFTMPLTDMVNPNHIGVDIGCGIISAKLDIRGIDIRKSLEEADLAIRKVVPMGMNYNTRFVADKEWNLKEIDTSVYSFSSKMNIPSIEINEQYIEKLIKKIGIDGKIFYKSLGSLGGGNHFIELGMDEDGDFWLTIHSGSRNFGLKVANYYTNAAKKQQFSGEEYARELEEMKNSVKNKRMLPQLIKELKYKHNKGISKEYLRGDLMKSYLIDMAVAQMYAKINRQTMLNNMCKILGFGIVETIESVHNYISPTDLMIRKGAISAHTNELCIIPFNMKDGLLVCKGKGNNDWNNSAPHGAGRVFSRSAAKANISMKDYRASMREVYSSSINLSTLDEAPQAYKSPKLIELLIAPTVKILHRIKPVLNIKASE